MNPSSLANSCDVYLRPLSVTTGSGIPYLAKIDLRCRIAADDVVSTNLALQPTCEKCIRTCPCKHFAIVSDQAQIRSSARMD